ncbi:protein transport protein HofC [Pantoea agglomerans]|uniref:protein transport protein HofC n=1 Tax=Enterobacter agglomerans TaxID=549 RepID=UPI001653F6A5|nr:protein transport protein HofC [Pantoea agglomerans]
MADASLFRWQAVDSQGQLVSGQLLAIDSDNLLLMLAQRDLLPVSWKREKVWRQREWKWQHKTDLIRQLATLLKAGLPLAESLALLAEGHPHAGWRALMLVLHHRVLSGAPFSQALREWPQIFPTLYPALMEVGELTGQLDTCCSELARQQIRQQQLWHQVAKALRYPLFILLVAIAVTCGMLLFVLPEFVAVYDSFDAPLPAFTAAVMQLSAALQEWGAVLAIGVSLMLVAWHQLRRRSAGWQRREQAIFLRIPLLSGLWRGTQLTQIYTILNLTQRAGLTLLQGLAAVEVTLSSLLWREAMAGLQQHIAQGNPLHQALMHHPLFTPLCAQLVRVGEEAGALDLMLARLAEWHEAETRERADTLAASLEPMMMVVIGGIVGTLVIAMYLPVFGLGDAMH